MTEPIQPIAGALLGNDRLARAAAMGLPAFVRRAQRLEQALAHLRASLQAEREARLVALLPEARELHAWQQHGFAPSEHARAWLAELVAHPRFARAVVAAARGRPERWQTSLGQGVRQFNRRWLAHLQALDLGALRELQEIYNRCYPIERELAMPQAPKIPFEPVPLLDVEDLHRWFPPLPQERA